MCGVYGRDENKRGMEKQQMRMHASSHTYVHAAYAHLREPACALRTERGGGGMLVRCARGEWCGPTMIDARGGTLSSDGKGDLGLRHGS